MTTTGNSVDYRLLLASERKPHDGSGVATDMMIYPAIRRSHHFCGLTCLDHWRARGRHVEKLWEEWAKSKEYTALYGDGRKAKAAEFEAAALAAFPMRRAG